MSNSPVLGYYNPEEELVLQVDSSEKGLGAELLQEGKPLEYASRNLRTNERKWSQLEKETLAIVFGLEKFDQYTYGRKSYHTQRPQTIGTNTVQAFESSNKKSAVVNDAHIQIRL